jgi:hypothetical protein
MTQEARQTYGGAQQSDIWAGYNPDNVRKTLRNIAGTLRGVDRAALLTDVREQRESRRTQGTGTLNTQV